MASLNHATSGNDAFSAMCDVCRKPVFWSTDTVKYLYSFCVLFVLCWVKLNNYTYFQFTCISHIIIIDINSRRIWYKSVTNFIAHPPRSHTKQYRVQCDFTLSSLFINMITIETKWSTLTWKRWMDMHSVSFQH